MDRYSRAQKMAEAFKEFKDVEFTTEQEDILSKNFEPIPQLMLFGPDCRFEDALHNHVILVRDILKKNEEAKLASIDLKGPIYGVPWIEVEFGQRPEGWALFVDLDKCIKDTKTASRKGAYDGGYIGPERPLYYYELPIEGMSSKIVAELKLKGKTHTDNYWSPKYRGNMTSIKE